MLRKCSDPRLIALLDKREKLQAECEQHYGRRKRAFNRLEKAGRALARVSRQLAKMNVAANGAA